MSGQLPMHLEEPPFLSIGTEVSAKCKGAFCEAKIKNISKLVKCKVQYSNGSVGLVSDDTVKGLLKVGNTVEVKCNDKTEFVEAVIQKIQDCSQYTVVFDDGDISSLKRTSLCLKSGRHFATGATLDQLPLTHPEHIGITQIRTKVVNNRRSRKHKKNTGEMKDILHIEEKDIGKVICVKSNNNKKKLKDNWFPGLIVSPTAQTIVKTNITIDYLVRSFKDGKYYTVPKKEIAEFTKEIASRVENPTLKTAVEKAILYLDKDEIPPHWDRDLLFGIDKCCMTTDSEGTCNTDTSDEESIEEKDHFVAQLFKFMDDRGTPINQVPVINDKDVDLYKLFKVVNDLGGFNKVNKFKLWKNIAQKVGHEQSVISVKQSYQQYLHSFEDFYRKLGCTMLSHPRVRSRNSRFSRSIIRDIDKTPLTTDKNRQTILSNEKKDKRDDTSKNSLKKNIKSSKNEETFSYKTSDKKKDDINNCTSNNKLSVKWDPDILEATDSKIKKDDSVETRQIENVPMDDKKDKKRIYTKNLFGKSTKKTVKKEKIKKIKTVDIGLSGSRKIRALKKHIKTIVKVITPFKKTKKSTFNIEQEIFNKTNLDEDMPKLTRSKSKEDIPAIKRKLSLLNNHDIPVESTTCGFNLENQNKIKNLDNGTILEKKRKKDESSISTLLSGDFEALTEDTIITTGDNLIVYYGDTHTTTYDAKVLNVCNIEGEIKYYVHYKGWNSRYDEWINKTRIAFKCNNLELDDTESLKSEKKPIDQKKIVKTINRTRRSVTPSSNVSTNSLRKKSPFTISTRPTRTCTLNDKSLASIDNSDSETDYLENSGLTKKLNKKSYPLVKNIKTEPNVIIKTEPSDIDQKKKLNPKTYLTKEMLIQKLSPKKLKSCVMKDHDNTTEKIEISEHVTLKKPFDFNFKTETSISSNSTSNLNSQHVETQNDNQNVDGIQNELKIAPNHYLSPKEKSERQNQQLLLNENIEKSTEKSTSAIKSKITGRVYSKSSSEYNEFKLKEYENMPLGNLDKSKIFGTDFDLNKIRSEMKGLIVNNTESYILDQNVKIDDLKSTKSTEEDIYEFKEHEPCDFKTIPSIIEDKHRRIIKQTEPLKLYNFEKSIEPPKVIEQSDTKENDENFTKVPNLEENLVITNNAENSISHIQLDEMKEDSLRETCNIEVKESNIMKGEVLNLCMKARDLLPNNMFSMSAVNDTELDDDDDDSKLIIAEVDKMETNYQIHADEHNSSNGQTENVEIQPLILLPQSIHELPNTDSEFQNSNNISKDTNDESTVSCNGSIQNFQLCSTNIYQTYGTKSGCESNSKSPTTECTDNVKSTIKISIDKSINNPKMYDYENKKPNYISKNENVIFPELQCKEEILDEDTLNNALVIKYNEKSIDQNIHKPSTSKKFYDSMHQSNKNDVETDLSNDVKNNLFHIEQTNLVKNVIFDTTTQTNTTSKNIIFHDDKPNNNKDGLYDNSSIDKKKTYSSDGDINNVLLCEETIPGSPTGISEDHYNQEKGETCVEQSVSEVASIMYAIKKSFNKPMVALIGATNEEMNQYTDIIQNNGILDQRHLQFLAEISSRNADLIINEPPELDSEPVLDQTVKDVTKTKRKNSHEHHCSVSKRNKTSSISTTEDNAEIPQKNGKPLVSFTPDMDSVQRQALISAKINDLRKEYLLVKSRITVVDRRRKKIKKRKKELMKLSAIDKTHVTG